MATKNNKVDNEYWNNLILKLIAFHQVGQRYYNEGEIRC